MKKFLAVGLAGAVALSALAGTVSVSQAAPFHPKVHHGSSGFGPGAFVAGTILGLGIAAAASQPYYEPYPVYPYPAPAAYPAYGNLHVQWCYQHYPNSYNPATNTFVGYNGVVYYCNSPYN